MPMMPMEPAKAVMMVRPFFVMRLLNDSDSAVKKLMRVLFAGFAARADASTAGSNGSVSLRMTPSERFTMRVA